MRRIVFKVALVGLGLTLASLLAEGLVRAIAPQFRTPLRVGIEDTILDPRYGWKWIPNSHHRYWHGVTVDINSLGLRDREYGPKQSGEFRILSLGDSYAYGFGLPLEQTYTKVLERMLNARFPANRFSVINAGVSGYGTRQMTLSVRDLRDVLHPDFAVATFVAGNDVYDDWIFPGQLQQQAKTPLCWSWPGKIQSS